MPVTKGFTLVELAIAMTIIGLLIAGVLKGQEMLNNARVVSTIRQKDAMETAVYAFRDKYSQLPGDFSKAASRLPGCTPENSCQSGNGDGAVGLAVNAGMVPILNELSNNFNTLPHVETALFWKHLALVDLINGVDPGAPLGPWMNAWGVTHPKSPLSGGVYMGRPTCGDMGGIPSCGGSNVLIRSMTFSAHYFTFSADFFQNVLEDGRGAISPNMLMRIDRKIDDGSAVSGAVIAMGFVGGCDTWDSIMPLMFVPKFDEKSQDPTCDMVVRTGF